MGNYNDLKNLMLQKGFIFENYGKVIKKDNIVLSAAGKNTTKKEVLYQSLDTFFRINNYIWIMENFSTADFKTMINKYL